MLTFSLRRPTVFFHLHNQEKYICSLPLAFLHFKLVQGGISRTEQNSHHLEMQLMCLMALKYLTCQGIYSSEWSLFVAIKFPLAVQLCPAFKLAALL